MFRRTTPAPRRRSALACNQQARISRGCLSRPFPFGHHFELFEEQKIRRQAGTIALSSTARIWSARPWLGILTCLLAATLAAPASRAATMYVSTFPPSIFQVSASGVISPFATLPADSHPYGGLAFDSSGNLFVADSLTSQISKITPGGAVSRFATVPNDGVASGLAIDRSGNLYVRDVKVDPVNPNIEQIDKITPAGIVTHFAVLPGTSSRGLAFDAGGNLYVADSLSDQINKITSAGVVSLFATVPRGSFPVGLAFDGNGNLYVADYYGDQISKITPGGVVSRFASLPGPSRPYGLAFDGGGNLYYASYLDDGGQIGRISPDGLTVSTFAKGLTDPAFIAFAPTPEPSSAVLLGIAGGSIFLRRGRRRISDKNFN